MAQDEPAVALYDFLYRDSNRIASYYAQLFGGRLSSTEQSDLRTKSGDKTTKIGSPLAAVHEERIGESVQSGGKRIIDPHDLITTDVLSALSQGGYLSEDIENAPHGALVIVKGTVVFVDKSVSALVSMSLDMLIHQSVADDADPEQLMTARFISLTKSFLDNITIPSAFLLQGSGSLQIVGTIKDEGMEEPISSYYFKHGSAGLSDVYLIGFKEIPSPSVELPDTQIIGAMQQAAQGLSDMLFPPSAIRITPVAIFRKLDFSD